MAVIHVDGKQYEVDGASNLLQACLSLGLDIPYFCWHPALGSVGACRQCAVKQYANAEDAAAGKGRLVMSCMTPSADNTFISIDDDEARAFRATIIEYLMTNHPHDCPVCEEGGHCHLQDMTVMTGHDRRRYRFTKRTHHNQYLGPFISHEMNRCIACYRCVRYYQDYAGGQDLGVYASASKVYFGRPEEGVLESEFAGNLVEVCPTGVFTDKTHSEHYTRKWDMQFGPSICQQCSVGCNISAGERYGEIRRIENRYNGEVNRYFLCDRGRFGYGYTNLADRPRTPMIRRGNQVETLTVDAMLDQLIQGLQGKRILGIGSPRASLESNFALQELVGRDNFCTGLNEREQQLAGAALDLLQMTGIYTPSLAEMEQYDAVVVVGEDVTQTAPRIALAIRQAGRRLAEKMAEERKTQEWLAEPVKRIGQRLLSPIYLLSVSATRLDDVAESRVVGSPNDIARLAYGLADCINGHDVTTLPTDAIAYAQEVADVLKQAGKVLIVSGTSLGDIAVMEAAAALAQATGGHLTLTVPEVNSMGLAMLTSATGGISLDQAAQQARDYDVAIVLENDLSRRLSTKRTAALLAPLQQVIVLDQQHTSLTSRADVILPAASFAEGDGTVISQEGRAQRYFQVFEPSYYQPAVTIKESWRWLHAIHTGLENRPIDWTRLDQVIASLARKVPQLAAIADAAPDADYRVQGLKIARESRRYSGRTSMRAPLSVHEPRQPRDIDTALTFSMEGYVGPQGTPQAEASNKGALIPFAYAPGWSSPSSWNKFQEEVGGALKGGDPGVRLFDHATRLPRRTFVAPAPQPMGQFLLVPIYSIWASDELAALSPAIQERIAVAGEPKLWIGPATAAQLNIRSGQKLSVSVSGQNLTLPVALQDDLAMGMIGYPGGRFVPFDVDVPVAVGAVAEEPQLLAVGE